MTMEQMRVVVSVVAKEHDLLFEDITNSELFSEEDIKGLHTQENALRTFLLEARDKGFYVNSLYTLDYKIAKLSNVDAL